MIGKFGGIKVLGILGAGTDFLDIELGNKGEKNFESNNSLDIIGGDNGGSGDNGLFDVDDNGDVDEDIADKLELRPLLLVLLILFETLL